MDVIYESVLPTFFVVGELTFNVSKFLLGIIDLLHESLPCVGLTKLAPFVLHKVSQRVPFFVQVGK